MGLSDIFSFRRSQGKKKPSKASVIYHPVQGSPPPQYESIQNAFPRSSIDVGPAIDGIIKPQAQEYAPSRRPAAQRATFWEAGSPMPLPQYDPNDILIAVMGMTGAGKTSFISQIANVEMKIGHGLQSCTREIGVATMEYQGRRVHLIDTPGFDDTDLKDADILQTIAMYLTGSPTRRVRLSGLVGSSSMKNVVLVTTMWGLVKKEDGKKRMDELAKTDNFWGRMIENGATCEKYAGTYRDGMRILEMLIPKPPCVLQIQAEIEGGVSLVNTTAGREVNERIEELKAQHKAEINELRKEMEQALKQKDIELYEKRMRDQEIAMQKMEEAKAKQEQVFQDTIAEQQAQIQALQDKSWCVVM